MKKILLVGSVLVIASAAYSPASAEWHSGSQWSNVIADYVAKGYDDKSTNDWNTARGHSLWSSQNAPFGYNCYFDGYHPRQQLNCQQYDMRTGAYLGRIYWTPPYVAE
jgi:hypothetical protein